MKPFVIAAEAACMLLLSGCATLQQQAVLARVGPSPAASRSNKSEGYLLVYSAFDIHPNFTSIDPFCRQHTNYKIFDEEGKLLQEVRNHNGTLLESPTRVSLPIGRYNVVARANGFGAITVPIAIRPDRVTTIHLEGGGDAALARVPDQKIVRLQDGEIIGWKAEADEEQK